MADHVVRHFSKREIKEAGKMLATDLPYTEEAIIAFRIAHNWRMAHTYPMIRERINLSRAAGSEAVTAGRIKRMDSIRKKLRRSRLSLDEMQDLAGVRAIMPDMAGVRRVVALYQRGWGAGHLRRVNDYVSEPKRGGYRSIHLIRAFRGGGRGAPFQGQNIEVQIRTRLQHVWATTVEAVGALRGEDMKAGEGDAAWLRLLELMSAYIAMKEGLPISDHVPASEQERREELIALNDQLEAVSALSTLRAVVKGSETSSARYFLVRLDASAGQVFISAQPTFMGQGEAYFRAQNEGGSSQTVMVAVDDAAALRRAYPNYFLDVGEFVDLLRSAVGQKSAIDRLDLSFLRQMS